MTRNNSFGTQTTRVIYPPDNFGVSSLPSLKMPNACVVLLSRFNQPLCIKQRGLCCLGVSVHLNSFNTPDHLKWDLM